MKFVVACEDTGAIKVVNALHGTDTSKPADDASPAQTVSITTHAEGNTRRSKVLQLVHSKQTGNIIVWRPNGVVEVYDTSKLEPAAEQSKERVEEDSTGTLDLLQLVYEHKGLIPPFENKDSETFIDLLIDDSGRVVVATNKGSVFIWSSEDKINHEPVKFTLPLNENEIVEAFQVHPGKENVNCVAYGGKETDLRVVKLPSLEKTKKQKGQLEITFKAKNLSNSRLELRVPIHIKKILFDKTSSPNHLKIYTFTQWGDMRFYDSVLGRKPRSSVLVLPKKASIINAIWLDGKLVLSDNTGIVVKVDPSSGSQMSKFKGHIGTTHALDNFQDSILATTGSDRYVRAYDNETRECIVKIFVGTQSNAVAIMEDTESWKDRRRRKYTPGASREEGVSRANNGEQREEEESSDEEELWNKLESNITQRRKRRRLALA